MNKMPTKQQLKNLVGANKEEVSNFISKFVNGFTEKSSIMEFQKDGIAYSFLFDKNICSEVWLRNVK